MALSRAHRGGISPTACSLSLLRLAALAPGNAKQLGLQLSPTSSFLLFHQLLPAAGIAPCRDMTHSPMPGLGFFSPPALAFCPGSITNCMASSQSSHFFCCPVFHTHNLNITKGTLKSVRNFLWPSFPFSDGIGLVLLWPENVQQSIQQPPHPQRSAYSPAVQLLEKYWESRQQRLA